MLKHDFMHKTQQLKGTASPAGRDCSPSVMFIITGEMPMFNCRNARNYTRIFYMVFFIWVLTIAHAHKYAVCRLPG